MWKDSVSHEGFIPRITYTYFLIYTRRKASTVVLKYINDVEKV